jgi:hypothetical protein
VAKNWNPNIKTWCRQWLLSSWLFKRRS